MSAQVELDALVTRLTVLGPGAHPLGLSARAAERLRASSTSPEGLLEGLAQVERTGRLGRVLAAARPADGVGLVHRLVPALGLWADLERRVRAAASYPLVLLLTAGLAALGASSVGLPALALLAQSRGGPAPGGGALWPVGLACVTLALLSLVLQRGWKVGALTSGRRARDRVLVLETALGLHAAGADLGASFRGAAAWSQGALREATDALARAFEAGAAPLEARALLGAEALAVLLAAAKQGLAVPVLEALAEEARVTAEREVRDETERVSLAALVVAGAAVAWIWVSWYSAYLTAVTG